jgi:hypothetical protein
MERKEKMSDDLQRAVDSADYDKFTEFSGRNPVKKTLALYGIDFYIRVCFRKYQFQHVIKLVEDSVISKDHELVQVKRLLAEVRKNADRDMKLQEFSIDINLLEKVINKNLK